MSTEKFDVKISFTDISIPVFAAIFSEILKANPELVTSIEAPAAALSLTHKKEADEAKVVPLETEKPSKKGSGKSETKSSPKNSKGGKSKVTEEAEDDGDEDEEVAEKEEKTSKKSSKPSKTPSTSGGTKSSGKSKVKEEEPEEDDEDEESDDELPEPVQVPEEYNMESLKKLISDVVDNGYDVIDEVLEYFDIKSIKALEKGEIKTFYKKFYKTYKAAAASDEDGE